MKVHWTEAALADLDALLAYTGEHYPSVVGPIDRRIRAVADRIGRWPESGRSIEQRPNVRVVPLVRYPYRVFYRIDAEAVAILHIHHAAREEQ